MFRLKPDATSDRRRRTRSSDCWAWLQTTGYRRQATGGPASETLAAPTTVGDHLLPGRIPLTCSLSRNSLVRHVSIGTCEQLEGRVENSIDRLSGNGKIRGRKALALWLGWDWLDADVELELRAGKSIAAIFADDGEPAFREIERAILAEVAGRDCVVLATGGGVVLHEANRVGLRNGAKVVWLKARPETIFRRVSDDWNTVSRRPNLTTGGLEEIREVLERRTPLYRECADLEIDTDEDGLAG